MTPAPRLEPGAANTLSTIDLKAIIVAVQGHDHEYFFV